MNLKNGSTILKSFGKITSISNPNDEIALSIFSPSDSLDFIVSLKDEVHIV